MWTMHLVMGVKTALGAVAAMALAEALGLQYAATAGVIAVLSIMGTRRETLRIAAGRLAAFLSAMVIAWGCFELLGFTLAGYGAYLLLFTCLCGVMGWTYAVSMVAVLASHVLAVGSMSWAVVANEALLFLIGAACGMAVNLHLRPDAEGMRRRMQGVDEGLRHVLKALARGQEGLAEANDCLQALEQELALARRQAEQNAANTFAPAPLYPLRYVRMRADQRRVLQQMAAAMGRIGSLPPQYAQVCALLARVEAEFSMTNDVAALLEALERLVADMRAQPLPAERAEFESRALLYYVLLRLEDFLQLKRRFVDECGTTPRW